MNWDAVGAIGEIVGAVAVVASLAYLAVQIRTQNAESRAVAMHNISIGFRDSINTFTDPQMATLMSRANSDGDDLSEPELIQLYAGVTKLFRVWEEAYLLHQRGHLDEDIWESMMRQYAILMGAKSFRRIWENRKDVFNPEFQKFADAVLPTGELIWR